MKKIVNGSRAILANDDNTGAVGVIKYTGGRVMVKDSNGNLLYQGYSMEEAAAVIVKHQQRNKRLEAKK